MLWIRKRNLKAKKKLKKRTLSTPDKWIPEIVLISTRFKHIISLVKRELQSYNIKEV